MTQKQCALCGKPFETNKPNRIYCCKKCQIVGSRKQYAGHWYKARNKTQESICPMCRKKHKTTQGRWIFCNKCKEKIERNGIVDTVSEEYHIARR